MKKVLFKSKLFNCFYLLLLMNFVVYHHVYAAYGGKISGKVTDSETGKPLIGANVIIEGTTMGAAAGLNGEYFIINVSPGSYNLMANVIGYAPMTVTGVLVKINQTITANFSLTPQIIEGQEVIVVAEKHVVQLDVANTQTILTGDDIAALPVAQFNNILDKQVGIREADSRGLFFRGSPQASVSLTLDGIETRDNVDNQIYTRVNPDEVEQVEVLTGGFNAEYGNASAGVISVVTKEGGDKYSGTFDYRYGVPHRKHFGPSLRYYFDQYYLGPEFDWEKTAAGIDSTSPYIGFRDRPELLKELYKWRMRDEVSKYGHKPDLNFTATFGGPIPFLKNTTFFTSVRRENTNYLYNGSTDHFSDGGVMAKITSHIIPGMKINLTCRYTETIGVNRYDRRLVMEQHGIVDQNNPGGGTGAERRFLYQGVEAGAWSSMGGFPYADRMSISERYRNSYGITLNHTLSSRTFYEINLLYSNYRVHGAPPELRDTTATKTFVNPADTTYRVTLKGEYALAPDGFWDLAISEPWGVTYKGTYGLTENDYDKNIGLKVEITSQVNKYNQVSSGLQFTYTDLLKDEWRNSADGKSSSWYWHVYPKHLAIWLKDKLEFEGMIANIGLRADCRIPHHRWFDTVNNPYDYHWSDSFAYGTEDSTATGPHYKPPVKWVLAPRLSISNPIGASAKIFFNWGHYYQEPPYERQYYFMRRYDAPTFWIYGNPELEYQKTVQYEVGYEQNILDMFRVAATGFYKDNTNLVNGGIRYSSMSKWLGDQRYRVNYETYNSNYYQSIRGLQFTIEKRVGKFWTGWFNYDYEIYGRGKLGFQTFFEDSTRAPSALSYASENRSMVPMPRFNVGVDLHTHSQFGPSFGRIYPMADMNLNLLFWWRSQPTYTYTSPDKKGWKAPYAPLDNMKWKAHYATNLVFTKRFSIGKAVTPVFYVEIYNLFNTKNMFRNGFGGSTERYIELLLLDKYGDDGIDNIDDLIERLDEEGRSIDELINKVRFGDKGDLAEEAIVSENQVISSPSDTPFKLYINPRQIWIGLRLEFN